ncbi:hypothetical protein HaLaN_20725 [Haematococcus lacustris]|uniref:Uncharacterized protein n=1 Tax=Haematococcus lacustris TaxID=44745 RepID=A0A699ZK56_HAELA|nr:hypothetical protein HaLaN_20725 [Haematococcus lacustris]
MSKLARPVKTEPGFLLFIPRVMLGVLTLGALGVAAGLAGPGRGFKDEAEFRKVMQERRHELKRHSGEGHDGNGERCTTAAQSTGHSPPYLQSLIRRTACYSLVTTTTSARSSGVPPTSSEPGVAGRCPAAGSVWCSRRRLVQRAASGVAGRHCMPHGDGVTLVVARGGGMWLSIQADA